MGEIIQEYRLSDPYLIYISLKVISSELPYSSDDKKEGSGFSFNPVRLDARQVLMDLLQAYSVFISVGVAITRESLESVLKYLAHIQPCKTWPKGDRVLENHRNQLTIPGTMRLAES